jgi:hypothetical protein
VAPAVAGDFCANAIDLTGQSMPYSWPGNFSSYTSGFSGTALEGCANAGGRDVWFEVFVEDGNWLMLENSATKNVAFQLFEDCDATSCLAAGNNSLFWQNDTGADLTVRVAVEGKSDGAGDIDLGFDVVDVPPTAFGPDSFGYFGATDDDLSACPDISADGTLLSSMGDETVEEVTMGIDFRFYGETYGKAWIATNGFITFESSSSIISNYEIPSVSHPYAMVAPYWHDLDATGAEGIYYKTYQSGGQDVFQVQYRILPYLFGGTPTGTYDFSVVLEESTGKIHFCYVDTDVGIPEDDLGVSATCGIQQDDSVGLQYSYLEAKLTEGLHIWFIGPSS